MSGDTKPKVFRLLNDYFSLIFTLIEIYLAAARLQKNEKLPKQIHNYR